MAEFPIARTNRLPSGKGAGVAISLNYVDRSGEIIGNALIRLGGVAAEEADKWNRLHAETEFSQATREAGLRLNTLANDLEKESDPLRYEDMHKRTLGEIKGLRPKNGVAAKAFDIWVNSRIPAWNAATASAIRGRQTNMALDDLKQKQGDFLGKFEGTMTDVVLESGTDMALKVAQDSEVLAEAATKGITAEDLMAAVRRAGTMADQIRAELKAQETLAIANEEGRREKAKREINSLLANIGDPSRPQPTFELIHGAGLDPEDELRYLNLVKDYTKERFEDRGDVLAVILEKQQQAKLSNDEVWEAVGNGLSPQTAARITDPDSFYSDWGFRQAEQFLKGSLSYSEIAGWENPEGQLSYTRAMKDLTDAILRADPPVRGRGIMELAVRTATPYLTNYWSNVTSKGIGPESRQTLTRQLEALGGASQTQPTKAPAKSEIEKAKDIFGIN
jgi:hypothetical protein